MADQVIGQPEVQSLALAEPTPRHKIVALGVAVAAAIGVWKIKSVR